jgi:hypothetical protein
VLLIAPVLLGIVVALLRGGSLRYLATLPFRGAGAIVVSCAIQMVIYVPGLRDSALARQGGAGIYIGALLLVLFGVARNWRLGIAARVALTGLALNMAVIVANGGHMPVNATAMRAVQGEARVREIAAHLQYANTEPANGDSRLVFLSDIFPVPVPFGHGNVYSIGDALIAAGAASLAFQGTRRPWGRTQIAPDPMPIMPRVTQPRPLY